MNKTNQKAWHFVRDNGYLRSPVGRYKKARVGVTLKVDPKKLELCKYGLHASIRPLDALQYAPGSLVCRVELGGRIIKDKDKLVASERTVLWLADATNTLHEFACRLAEDALKKAGVTDNRCWNAIKVKRLWVAGQATDAELDAARYAARTVASNAAKTVAITTARTTHNKRLTAMLNNLGKTVTK